MSIPNRIAILNSDGTTDTTFAPSYGLNAAGRWVSVLSSGDLLVGGDFTQYDTAHRAYLATVSQQGDVLLPPTNANSVDYTGVAQTDGKAIVAGSFTQVAGSARNRIARLQADLSVEDAYNPNASAVVYAAANQGDGKTVIGGGFSTVGGVARNCIARLYNDEAVSTLTVLSVDLIRWLRGGSMQETQTVVFAVSTDGGTTYTDIPGTLTPIAGGWDFVPDTSLATSGLMRGRAYTTDSHSEGIQETVVSFSIDPDIQVSVDGTILEDGVSSVAFDSIQVGTTTPKVFTIANLGLSDLNLTNGPNHVQLSGTNADQWSLTAQPSSPISPGQSVTFQLVFDPTSSGSKTATVTINSDDPDEDPFTFTITGVAVPGPGSVDSSWAPVANARAYTSPLTLNDVSYPAGVFTTLNGVARGRIASLDSSGVNQTFSGTGANNTVNCAAILSTGKILIGGLFTSVFGVARSRLARLNSDNSLDSSFALSANGEVLCLAEGVDGKVYVGGLFTTLSGRSSSLVRLTASGTVDTTFAAVVSGTVNTVVVQENGKVLVGGRFYANGGATLTTLARFNPDGALDAAFTSSVSATAVFAVAVQSNGKILVSSYSGSTPSVHRINSDGTADSTYTPSVAGNVSSLVLQTDGKALIAAITSSGATGSVARLAASNGADDTTFVADASGAAYSICIQTDGKPLIAGNNVSFAGGSPRYLARLVTDNNSASSVLSVVSSSQVQWLRGGTLPEATQVVFRYYPTGSTTAVTLGQGTRIDGGWELTGIALPVSGTLSAYALIPCGYLNGSSSFMEKTVEFSNLPVADLAIEYPVGTVIADGGSVTYPGTLPGQSADITFTLRNTGNASLNSIVATVDGEWTITSAPAATLAAGGTTTMTVRFSPTGTNQRGPALLSVASSVPGTKNPYAILLYGNGVGLPTCTTGANTSGGVGARNLSGTFKANHDAAVAYFQYKLSSSTTWLTSATQNISGFTNVTVTKTVSGLTPGQVYQYRAAIYNAVNAASPTYGAISTFTA